ncbi:replication fork protection component Swi3-domain-containing protein [Choanephora cucurbitarum]|nr:replication fork protection component Swi3-domain-containing protein [Choanephora cucurbitarum]
MSEFDDLLLDDYELDGELTKQLDGLLNNTAAPSSETQDLEEMTKKSVKRPKLDDERLLGEKGISALKNRSQYLNFKGKGHEEQDLKDLMQFYMFWANNLFPKLKFQDFAKRVTKPASTAAVKSQIKTWQEEFKERRQVRLEVENELNRQNESEDEQSRLQEEEEEASSEDDNRPLFFPITKPLPTNKPKPKKAVHRPHQVSTHESNKSVEHETESSSLHKKRRMVSLDDSSDEEQEPSSSGTKSRKDVLALLQERRRQKEDAKKKEQEKAEQEELMKKKKELERSAEDLTQEYLGEDVELALSDNELLSLNKDDTSFSDNELIQDLDTHQEEDEPMTDV